MNRDVKRAGVLAFITVAVSLWLFLCCKVPRKENSETAPVLALEMATSPEEARAIIGENSSDKQKFRIHVKADYLLIAIYTITFLSFGWLFRGQSKNYLFWLVVFVASIAAIADVAENHFLLKGLSNDFDQNFLSKLHLFYQIKWIAVFVTVGLLSILFLSEKSWVRIVGLFFLLTAIVGLLAIFQASALILGLAVLLMGASLLGAGIVLSFFPGKIQQIESELISTDPENPECTRNFRKVFAAELNEIKVRQGRVEKAEKKPPDDETEPIEEDPFSKKFMRTPLKETAALRDIYPEPSTRFGLVGLALSGGGIRAATFSLGVLQALSKNGLLPHVAYLSTVSGGGYMGSCLSALLNSTKFGTSWGSFPFKHQAGTVEPETIRHLRNSGNYLASRGVVDRLRLPALLLRGLAVNMFLVLPYLLIFAWITAQFHYDWLPPFIEQGEFHWGNFYCFAPWLILFFLGWILLLPFFYHATKGEIESRNYYERSFGLMLLALFAVALLESILPVFIWLRQSTETFSLRNLNLMGALTATISGVSFLFTGNTPSKFNRYIITAGFLILGLLGPLILFVVYLYLLNSLLFLVDLRNPIPLLALLFVYRILFDANVGGMHGFYRDRLSKAYLFKVNSSGTVEGDDRIKLSDLNQNNNSPYLLINSALNLQGSDDVNLRGRMSDFFFFSKRYCGSQRTGFVQTREVIEERDPHFDLGTAIAVSGAAASANMGTMTIRPLVFLMTLFNVRLGYWFPNPYQLLNRKWFRNLFPFAGVGPIYFLRELLGLLDDKSFYINLSDGGHIENLGIYSLLKRRCKFIVAVDAEGDPKMTFGGLAKLIRYARIDLAVDIDIDLDDVRLHEDGLSRKHCAMGRIYYGDGQTGYLLYIKSSLTGDENEYIQEYKTSYSDFPHETTADQFFSEVQFEVYRALGYHIADELFEQRDVTQRIQRNLQSEWLEDWFDGVYRVLLPRFQMEDQFVELQTELNGIEAQFTDEALVDYIYQIYPELAPVPEDPEPELPNFEESDERYYKILNICRQQMGFMQNVFVKMQLDQLHNREHYFNRGWMNLFRRWAQAPYFRRAWAVNIGTFSYGFQRFCEEALKISGDLAWRISEVGDLTNREREYLRESNPASVSVDVWLAYMMVNLTPGKKGYGTPPSENSSAQKIAFPVGFAAIDKAEPEPMLVCYRVRDYYRHMRLTEKIIPTLRDALVDHYEQQIHVFLAEEEYRLYAATFEAEGYTVIEGNPIEQSPEA